VLASERDSRNFRGLQKSLRAFASESEVTRHADRERRAPITWTGALTVALLVLVLFSMPLVLGGARLWFQLPVLELVALLMLVQAARLAFGPHTPLRLDVVDFSVLAFTLYAIVRWKTSPVEYDSRLEIFNVVAGAAVLLVCRYGLARRSQALVLLGLLIALGVFELVFGYLLSQHLDWQPFGPNERLHQYYAPRWIGTYASPNHYGEILIMAMSAALAWGAFSTVSWSLRILCFWTALLMMFGVVESGSRGSLIAAAVAIVALTIAGLRDRMVRWWLPVTGAVILIGGIGLAVAHSAVAQERLDEATSYITKGNLPTYMRIQLDGDALRIAGDHPIFGTGPATFAYVHPRYQDATFHGLAVMAHNDYLNTLADYGAVGLAIALVFAVAVTIRLLRRPRVIGRWQDRVLLATGFMAWSAMLVHSLVDYNMHIPGNALMLLALTGMGLRRAPAEADTPVRGWDLPRWPLAIALALLALAYGVEVGRTGLSAIIYAHVEAQALDNRPPVSIAAAKKALAFDPDNVPALIFLGNLYRIETAREQDLATRLADGQQALDYYQRAARENPLQDTTTASEALTYDLMGRYPEAYFCYVEALKHQPYDGQFWYRLGNHYWAVGLLEKAEQAYQMGLHCPNGSQENEKPAGALRDYLAAQGIPPSPDGTDPLQSGPETEHATVP
jgi:O-antigen ligase